MFQNLKKREEKIEELETRSEKAVLSSQEYLSLCQSYVENHNNYTGKK